MLCSNLLPLYSFFESIYQNVQKSKATVLNTDLDLVALS